MRRIILVACLFATAGFDASTGHSVVAERPLDSMVSIPQGQFLMGASPEAQATAVRLCREEVGPRTRNDCIAEGFAKEGPAKVVFVSAFQIDRVEVTVAAYRRCVQAGACSPEPLLQPDARFLQPQFPVSSVTWDEAVRYCGWRGARLPTEAEWERAARSADARTFPWGNVPRGDVSNHGRFFTIEELGPQPRPMVQPDPSDGWAFLAPVGSYPEGASADGVLDLAGNVREWSQDIWGDEAPQTRSLVNPRGPSVGPHRVLRGGSWREPLLYERTTGRDLATPDTRSPEIGFRCAKP